MSFETNHTYLNNPTFLRKLDSQRFHSIFDPFELNDEEMHEVKTALYLNRKHIRRMNPNHQESNMYQAYKILFDKLMTMIEIGQVEMVDRPKNTQGLWSQQTPEDLVVNRLWSATNLVYSPNPIVACFAGDDEHHGIFTDSVGTFRF